MLIIIICFCYCFYLVWSPHVLIACLYVVHFWCVTLFELILFSWLMTSFSSFMVLRIMFLLLQYYTIMWVRVYIMNWELELIWFMMLLLVNYWTWKHKHTHTHTCRFMLMNDKSLPNSNWSDKRQVSLYNKSLAAHMTTLTTS